MSAGLAYGVGHGFGLPDNVFVKAFAHGVSQGAVGLARGGKFKSGFIGAFLSHAVGGPIKTALGRVKDAVGVAARTVATAVVGGVGAALGGGKFANGATTAAFSYLFANAAAASRGPRGRALTVEERTLYAGDFPSEVLDSARIYEGKVPWWLRSDMDGITLGNKIYFREGVYTPGTAGGVQILGHELVHVQQYAEGMTIPSYLWESRRGYWNNRYEVEAYAKDRRIRNNFCFGNQQALGC